MIESQENRMDDKITKESDHRMMEVLAHSTNPSAQGKVRQKRPYRLLPLKDDNVRPVGDGNQLTINHQSRFYGPPTNCSDLSRLGYTLNGYYQVKTVNNSTSNDTAYLETF